jgi:iron complex outermembrane recepter protein
MPIVAAACRSGGAAIAAAAALFAVALVAAAADGATRPAPQSRDELLDMSLEELGNISITSVSRHAEKLSEAPASIFVITGDDIRRSGATSLPEALRLAPNLQVARVNTGQYAISARGFNNAIGNKLLVLIDGRTVYTPQYSGVNWDTQFVMLEDVERIEVISGPGATLWGANAVNGVINVLTKSSAATLGALVAVGGGDRESGVRARAGGKIGEGGTFRVYGMGFDRQNTQLANGTAAADGTRNGQAGFRADWNDARQSATIQGDAYQVKNDANVAGAAKMEGANLLGRWTRQLEGGATFNVQSYYDHTERDDPLTYRDTIDLFDIEFQHALAVAGDHKVMWGGGYRYAVDEVETHLTPFNPLPQFFMPPRRTLQWGNLFVQDEVALSPDLRFTVGLKAESNVYTGVEFLPSARLAWTPGFDKLFWGALSRAVRAPARLDRDFFLYLKLPNIPLIPVIQGGPDFQSEVAYVAELGYRAQPAANVSYSLTGFYSYYDKLRSGQPPPAMVQNQMFGDVYGLEGWGSYQPAKGWRLSAGLVLLRELLKVRAGSLDPTGPSALGNDPRIQWNLRSSHELANKWDLDVFVRHVGALPDPAVPAYTSLGVRLGWRPSRDLEVSITGTDATDPRHVEFGAPANANEIERGVFLNIAWRL